MKKVISMFLVFVLLFGMSVMSYAKEPTDKPRFVTYNDISASLQKHKDIISGKISEVSVITCDEYEIVEELETMEIKELTDKGYSLAEINDIKNGNAQEQIRLEIFKRVAMPSEQLEKMGYTNDEITALKSLTGDETLSDISARGILAKCTAYNFIDDCYYKTSKQKTYVIYFYGWDWDKAPVFLRKDIIGIGWDHDFAIDNSLDNDVMDYNTTTICYSYNSNVSVTDEYVEIQMWENPVNISNCTFEMQKMQYASKRIDALCGFGTMALSQAGKVNNVKVSFQYGHDKLGLVPSISISIDNIGIGFSIENAETTIAPPIAYVDFPRTIN